MYCRVYNSFITGLCYKNMNNLSIFLFNAQTSKFLKTFYNRRRDEILNENYIVVQRLINKCFK